MIKTLKHIIHEATEKNNLRLLNWQNIIFFTFLRYNLEFSGLDSAWKVSTTLLDRLNNNLYSILRHLLIDVTRLLRKVCTGCHACHSGIWSSYHTRQFVVVDLYFPLMLRSCICNKVLKCLNCCNIIAMPHQLLFIDLIPRSFGRTICTKYNIL